MTSARRCCIPGTAPSSGHEDGWRRSLTIEPMADEDAALDIDLLAASFRTDLSDLGAFVESLAVKLEDLLPTRVRVERRKDGMFGPKLVRRIEFDGDGQRLELRYDGRVIDTRSSRLSGGIVLKSEALGTDE